jgi:hypothetical protein
LPNELKDLRDFLFRGLAFEAEAEQFREAGIRIGADGAEEERSRLEDVMAPFDVSMRRDAMLMTQLYALMYCFENSVRELIAERLLEKHGKDWWEQKVPGKVKEFAKSRQASAETDTWLEGQKRDPLGFVDFGHLSAIIVENWDDFSDLVPSQHWLKQRMDELEKSRHFVAHNRLLLPGEFQRIEMYINDWDRAVGL